MKVAILTFEHSYNCGTTLQAFALQQAILENNCIDDCVLINHWTKKPSKPLFLTKPSITTIKGFIYIKKSRKVQRKFLLKHSKLAPNHPLLKNELADFCKDYDLICTGSDQVWNPVFTPGEHPLRFLLDFMDDDSKKIAYAPSFGTQTIDSEYKPEFIHYLKRFKHLSVRESAGQNIVQNLINVSPDVVVDPTLLFDKGYWERIAYPERRHDYIFLYEKQKNSELEDFADRLAAKSGLRIIRKRYDDFKLADNPRQWFIGPEKWLGLMVNASYVVTSSFHGVAFSLNFNKQFFVLPSKSTSSRIDELLSRFNLSDRVIGKSSPDCFVDINYEPVNSVLNEWRRKSRLLLDTFLRS